MGRILMFNQTQIDVMDCMIKDLSAIYSRSTGLHRVKGPDILKIAEEILAIMQSNKSMENSND